MYCIPVFGYCKLTVKIIALFKNKNFRDTDICIFVAKFCLLKSKLFCIYDCRCNLPTANMLITELQHMVHRVAKTALTGGNSPRTKQIALGNNETVTKLDFFFNLIYTYKKKLVSTVQ